MTPPPEVGHLVERFQEQREDYRRGRYNEAQLRQDFLNPFFKALGWDVHNQRGWSEAYREVIHEAAIKVGGRTKAPDYCFRAGGSKVLARTPTRKVEFSHPSDKARHDRMVELVERMLSLHKDLAWAKRGHDKTVIQRQIEATDRQIDRLVYELYELTDAETPIVEEAAG